MLTTDVVTMSARLALSQRCCSCRLLRNHFRLMSSQSNQLQGNENKSAKLSFRSQLYESTARRIQAEKAQHAQRVQAGRQSGATNSHRVNGSALGGLFGAVVVAIGFYYLGTQSVATPSITSTSPLSTFPKPSHNISRANLEASWTDFVTLLGEDNVKDSQDELVRHSTSDWSSFHNPDHHPFLVLYPSSTDEVSGIAKICHHRRIPMTPFSGGTSLEGHFAPTRGGVCIDFSRMNRVLALHKADLDVVVQPAVGWEQLNLDLEKDGLFFPPDPGPGAMIGGMIGTGCSGTNAARYGTMREWVISLTLVLADGTIIKTRQRPRKSSAGYDLTRLFIGSEGTLGLITEATLKLAVKPQSESVAVASFKSIKEAAETVSQLMGGGVPLAAVELLDDVQMNCINESGFTLRNWKEVPTLFFKFAGTASGVKEQIAQAKAVAKRNGSQSFEFATSKQQQVELWSARRQAFWSVMAKKRHENDKVWTTDVAVPLSKMPSIIEQTKDDINQSGLLGAIVGHVGDGNFHTILLFGKDEQVIAEGLVDRMVKRAVEMEGTVTGEHGIGLIKRDYLTRELGVETVGTMRKIKQALDPLCLLNCDKVIRIEKRKGGE